MAWITQPLYELFVGPNTLVIFSPTWNRTFPLPERVLMPSQRLWSHWGGCLYLQVLLNMNYIFRWVTLCTGVELVYRITSSDILQVTVRIILELASTECSEANMATRSRPFSQTACGTEVSSEPLRHHSRRNGWSMKQLLHSTFLRLMMMKMTLRKSEPTSQTLWLQQRAQLMMLRLFER